MSILRRKFLRGASALTASIAIMAICLCVAGCAPMAPKPVEGFAGYAFHSSYDGVRDDMTDEGYVLADSDQQNLWYDGTLYGYPVQFAYDFSHGELSGGYFDIYDVSASAWDDVGSELDKVYPGARSLPCSSGSEYCRVLCTVDAKLVHLLSDDREVHVVRYYERSPQHACNSDRSSN